MKIREVESSVNEKALPVKRPCHVCMHYAHKTDPRVMRDAIALVEAGFEVTIVDVESDRRRPTEETIRGVHFKHIFMPNYFVPARFKPLFLVKLVLVVIYGTIELLKAQADIYHAHVERSLPACYIAARLRGKPFIIDTPELTLTEPRYARWTRLNALVRRLIRHIVSYSAGYITASPLYPQELNKSFDAKNVKLILNVPPYQVVQESNRLQQHLGLGPDVKIALYQGYLQPNRRLERLIQAAAYLEHNNLIVLMGSGPQKTVSELEKLIMSEGVADHVKILPPVLYEELMEWTASANIGLTGMAPDYSLNTQLSLPNKFFEYLMAGLPVLSLGYDAVAEMIKKYGVGKLLSSLAPEDIGGAINAMLADDDDLARMSLNALKAARQEFYWEKESQKLIDLYNEILSKHVCMHVLTTVRTDPRVMRSATALVDAGCTVSIVDIVDEYTQNMEDIQGVSVKHVKMSRDFKATRFRQWAVIKALLLFLRSTLLLLRTPADIYHAHDFTALPACYIAAKLRNKPLIFDAHELPLSELDSPSRRWLRILLKPILAHMISRCDGGIGASPFYEQILRERYHISKVSLVRNFPPYQLVKENNRLRQQPGLNPSARVVLYQGNIQPDRRLDILVRAAAFLEDDIVIVMLGKGVEPTTSQLKTLIVSEGVTDRVKILPPVPYEELLDWTASADLGVTLIPLDSTLNMRTCLPNKLFEYLMAGLPVLTSPMEAVAPLVTSYDVGQVVHSLEPANLGAAINAMLGDSTGLARMRQNALHAAQHEFNWENERESLYHLYQDILSTWN